MLQPKAPKGAGARNRNQEHTFSQPLSPLATSCLWFIYIHTHHAATDHAPEAASAHHASAHICNQHATWWHVGNVPHVRVRAPPVHSDTSHYNTRPMPRPKMPYAHVRMHVCRQINHRASAAVAPWCQRANRPHRAACGIKSARSHSAHDRVHAKSSSRRPRCGRSPPIHTE